MHNSIRKATASVSAIALLATSLFTFGVSSATAALVFIDADDIAPWAVDSVNSLADAGVLSGRPDGSFDPQGGLNRAEVAKVATLGAGFDTDTTGAPHFNDVAAGDWFYPFVETLYNNGVVGGINNGALDSNGLATYNPGGALNRAEGAKILVDAFDLETSYAGTPPNFSDVGSSAWYYDPVETAYAHGILNGYADGNFGPGDPITREQVAVIGDNSITASTDGSLRRGTYTAGAASTYTSSTPNPVIPASDGTLNVSVSSTTSGDQIVPQLASSVPVAVFDFTASSSGDVTVTGVQVKREGLGHRDDFTDVFALNGDTKLSSGRSFNSDNIISFNFNPDLVVPAGSTQRVTFAGDMGVVGGNVAAGDTNFFSLVGVDSVTSNAKSVTGNFPVAGNNVELGSVAVGGVNVTLQTVSDSTVRVGETNQQIGKFKFTLTNVEDGTLDTIRFKQDGSADPGDLANFRLVIGSTEVAAVAEQQGDYIVFSNIGKELSKSDSFTVYVYADVLAGAASNIKISVDESEDVVITGKTYGYGLDINNGSSGVFATQTSTTVAIDAGKLTVSLDTEPAKDVSNDSDQFVLAKLRLVSGSEGPVLIKKLYGEIRVIEAVPAANCTTGPENGLENIKIRRTDGSATENIDASSSTVYADDNYDNHSQSGTACGSRAGDTGFGYIAFHFKDVEVNGTATFDVIADTVKANVANGDQFDFFIFANADEVVAATNSTTADGPGGAIVGIQAENEQGKAIDTDINPGSRVSSTLSTIAAPQLTLTQVTLQNSNVVKKTKDVPMLKLQLAANDVEDLKVTQIAVNIESALTAAQNKNNMQNFRLQLDDGTIITDGISPATATATGLGQQSKIDFTSIKDGAGLIVPQGSNLTVTVIGDAADSVTAGNMQGTYATNNLTAEREDGTELTNTSTNLASDEIQDAIILAAATRTMALLNNGTLVVTLDGDTPSAGLVQAGTTGNDMLILKLNATDEKVIIKKVVINNSVGTTTDDNIDKVTIYVAPEGSSDLVEIDSQSTVDSGSDITFDNLDTKTNKIIVDPDTDTLLYVKVDTRSSGTGPSQTADSGDLVTPQLKNATADFEARGYESGDDFTRNTTGAPAAGQYSIDSAAASPGNIVGNAQHIRTALVTTLAAASSQPSTGTLGVGEKELLKFTVTAGNNSNTDSDIILKRLKLAIAGGDVDGSTVTLSGTIFSSLTMYRTDDSSNQIIGCFTAFDTTAVATPAACTTGVASGNAVGVNNTTVYFATAALKKMTKGQTYTFVVKGTVAVAPASTSMQASISNLGTSGGEATVDGTTGNFIYTDDATDGTTNETPAGRWTSWLDTDATSVAGTSFTN